MLDHREFSFSMLRYILPCNKRDCFKWWPIKLHSPLNFIQHSMCFCYCKKHLRYRISYHISHVDCKKSSSTIKKTKEPLNILLFFHQIKKINAQRKRLSCSCIINNLSWRIHLISNTYPCQLIASMLILSLFSQWMKTDTLMAD